MTTSLARIRFFEKQVHMEEWKKSMSGKNEEDVIKILDSIGYKIGEDYVRQHPIGERFVIDFAFVKEQIALEVDGISHNVKRQKKLDIKRDKYLLSNNWVSLRIKDSELHGYKLSFYKNLIREIVKERREQWNIGTLHNIDIPHYNEKDYE